jgi:hypothetical protein
MDSLTSDGGVMMTTMVRRGMCSFIWALNRVRDLIYFPEMLPPAKTKI